MKLLSTTVTPTTAYMGDTITLASEVSETISSSHFAMWIIDFDATTDSSTPIYELINQGRVINSEWVSFSSKTDMSRTVQIDEDMLNIHTLTFILSQSSSWAISISDNPELFTIGDNISVSFKLHLYDKVKKLGNQWFYLKDEISALFIQKSNTVGFVKNDGSIESITIESIGLFDMLDCINVNFNNLDNIYLLDTVFNISNYNGLPSKNSSVVNDILRNNAVSGISLNKEFTPSTKYTLEFDYYTSVSNRNGFYFGADPSLEDGTSINNSNDGLNVIVDISNTFVETFNGTSSLTNVYTHTSNLLTEGTHHIRIVRDGSNATFYIDDVELYTYTNAKYNTIGLNKWGGGYNTISNIEITIGD